MNLTKLISVLCCAFSMLFAQELEQKIDAIINEPSHGFNGIILIAKGERILFEKAMGFASFEKEIPNTLDTQFFAGSISKQITASLLLQQIEKGNFSLQASIANYLPELGFEWASIITLHQMLNHTSGLIRESTAPTSPPGTTFFYSNYGYDLLGKVVTRLSSQSYEDCADELFKQCGMHHTGYVQEESYDELYAKHPLLSTGYLIRNSTTCRVDKLRSKASNPSGGVFTTAHDLLRWNLSLHEGKVLSPSLYYEMKTPSSYRTYKGGTFGYGYGIQVVDQDGFLEISHTGLVDGYLSTLIYYPESKISVILLENQLHWEEDWGRDQLPTVLQMHDLIRDQVRTFIQDKK